MKEKKIKEQKVKKDKKLKEKKPRKPLNPKLKALIAPTIYFVFAMVVAINSIIIFQRKYYLVVYIDGKSMQPTLNANVAKPELKNGISYTKNVDFGYIDQHKSAIDQIQRFSIITTLYPWDTNDYEYPYERNEKPRDSAYFKIKRVIAMPGETFKIIDFDVAIWSDTNNDGIQDEDEWTNLELPYELSIEKNNKTKHIDPITLGEDEYWVMGDNWGNSTDCSDHNGGDKAPIYYENITGVLVAIQGTCTLKQESGKDDAFINHHYFAKPIYYF